MPALMVELDEAVAAALSARAAELGLEARQLAAQLLAAGVPADDAAAVGRPAWTPRFLSAVVHEVRTPLSSLLLTAELLADDPRLEPRQQRFARSLLEAAGDLRALVDDLGELNRLRGGRVRRLDVPVPLAELLAELARELRDRLAERGVAWEVTVDPGAPTEVVTDSSWLHRIGAQLAASALAAGARRLDWRLAAAPAGVALSLTDDGEPVAGEELARLFEPFAVAGSRVRRSHGGSGLGLAVAAAAARMLGGALEATSDGPGATLVLTLPLRPVATAGER